MSLEEQGGVENPTVGPSPGAPEPAGGPWLRAVAPKSREDLELPTSRPDGAVPFERPVSGSRPRRAPRTTARSEERSRGCVQGMRPGDASRDIQGGPVQLAPHLDEQTMRITDSGGGSARESHRCPRARLSRTSPVVHVELHPGAGSGNPGAGSGSDTRAWRRSNASSVVATSASRSCSVASNRVRRAGDHAAASDLTSVSSRRHGSSTTTRRLRQQHHDAPATAAAPRRAGYGSSTTPTASRPPDGARW